MVDITNTFSYWIRKNLKDAYSGLIAQDIDLVLILKERKKFYFLEEKRSKDARIGPAQKVIFKMFDDFLQGILYGYKFSGTHLLYVYEKITVQDILKKVESREKTDWTAEIKNELSKLWDCTGKPPTKKTQQEKTGMRNSFLWNLINENYSDILIEKIDWIFVNYCTGYFILIEEFTRCKPFSEKKRDFINIIDSIFTDADRINGGKAKNPKSNAPYKYLGYYKLMFSETGPDNSEYISLNDKQIDKNQLIDLLNLENDSINKYRNKWW